MLIMVETITIHTSIKITKVFFIFTPILAIIILAPGKFARFSIDIRLCFMT